MTKALIEKLEEYRSRYHNEVVIAEDIIDDCIDIVKEHSAWVSVSERLPEKLQRILVCFKEKGIVSGTWFGGEESYFQSDNGLSDWFALADNTMEFWQPIQPPSEVQL